MLTPKRRRRKKKEEEEEEDRLDYLSAVDCSERMM